MYNTVDCHAKWENEQYCLHLLKEKMFPNVQLCFNKNDKKNKLTKSKFLRRFISIFCDESHPIQSRHP